MFEHWEYFALGALSMTPILGVLWSAVRGWRLKADGLEVENKRMRQSPDFVYAQSMRLSKQVVQLACKLQHERAVTAEQAERLNRIIARGKTKIPNSTVKAMVRIATGEE